MRRRVPFLLVAGALAAHAAVRASRPPSVASSLYDRSLERHIERTQEKLWDSLELWQDHSTWETAWRVRTEHYEVRTTHSRAFGLQLAQGQQPKSGLGLLNRPPAAPHADEQQAQDTARLGVARHAPGLLLER